MAIGKGDRPSGYEQEDQWKWLLNDLARMDKSKRLIVLDHTCCRDLESFCQREGGITIDFKNAGLLAWAFGHYHANVIHEYDGIYHIGSSRPDSGGIDSAVGGLRKIALKGHELSSELLYFTLPLQEADPYVWRTKLPGRVFFATPVMADEDVIVCTASDDYPHTCGVYRINGETGEIKWSFQTESAVKNDAALDETKVYVQDDKGWLYCMDVQSGQLIWKTAAKMLGAGYTLTGPVVVEDIVIAGTMHLVQAFDKKNGTVCWIGQKSSGSDCSPTRFVYDKDRRQVIAGAQWEKLYALDIQTGESLWENESDVRFRTSTPLLIGDKIYATFGSGAVILSAQTGETLLQVKTGCSMEVSGAPAFENGILYYPTSSKGVLGLNAETLEVVKHFPAAPSAIFPVPYGHGKIQTVETTPQIVNGELVFAGLDGCVRFYNKESCEQNRCIHVGAPCLATPIVKDGFVITADFDGNVTKFTC